MHTFAAADTVTYHHPRYDMKTIRKSGRTRQEAMTPEDFAHSERIRREVTEPYMTSGEAPPALYGGGPAESSPERKAYEKAEKQKAQAKQAPAPAQWSEAESAAQTKRSDETLRKARETLARIDREKQAKADRASAPMKEALAKLAKQAGGMTMAGNWHHENPAIGTLRKELERDGDPRTPEQFLRDLINANDKAAATKFREVKAAREKLMRQVSGQVD